uniref:Uncharacterized protein n=1 Tax=Triticum urartu TaxID=4572 RepID=A0A8R7V614_TRIUA
MVSLPKGEFLHNILGNHLFVSIHFHLHYKWKVILFSSPVIPASSSHHSAVTDHHYSAVIQLSSSHHPAVPLADCLEMPSKRAWLKKCFIMVRRR